MQNPEAIFDEVRRLVAMLNTEERLALIKDIANPLPISDHGSADEVARSIERRRQLKAEQESWYACSDAERQPYAGLYVAVYHGRVVDQDADRRALYLRIRQQFGDAPIPIIPSQQSSMPEFVIRSPKLG